MSWLYLGLAGLLEIAWAFALKASHGFSRPLPTLLTFACMTLSVWLLALALRTLPLGTAYAIWTGIGAAGAFAVGALAFGESVGTLRLLSMLLILAGIAGLKAAAGPV